jgi:hypothetical protein
VGDEDVSAVVSTTVRIRQPIEMDEAHSRRLGLAEGARAQSDRGQSGDRPSGTLSATARGLVNRRSRRRARTKPAGPIGSTRAAHRKPNEHSGATQSTPPTTCARRNRDHPVEDEERTKR